jgi:NAD(P)-dependent dehydrogenase (short-subunit alcohol dehydrogenase family)
MSNDPPSRRPARYDQSGRVAVVTGGAGGIGLASARRLIEAGARVSLWDTSEAQLRAAEEQLDAPGRTQVVVVDITSWHEVESALHAVETTFGGADILVNAAGVVRGNQPVEDYPDDVFDLEIAVNLKGPFLACKALVGGMKKRGWGRIVNLASISGHAGSANQVGYTSAKGALVSLTKTLAREGATSGVIVNAIVAGSIDTPFYRAWADANPAAAEAGRMKVPLERIAVPKEVAAMVIWLVSDDCSFSTGAAFDLTGGRAI